jgi:hypothetical protein
LKKSSPHVKSTERVWSSAKKNMKGTKLRSLWRRQQQNDEILSPSITLHANDVLDTSVRYDMVPYCEESLQTEKASM